jgi:hypothetical protein
MRGRLRLIAIAVLVCSCGGSGDFGLDSAAADLDHACPSAVSNAPYDVHVTVEMHNGRSSSVSIKGVAATMTLAAIHGSWLQPIGYRYEAQNLAYAPDHVNAGSHSTLKVTVPSSCTNRSPNGGPVSYADYSVALTITTSAGIFRIESKNKHRLIAA